MIRDEVIVIGRITSSGRVEVAMGDRSPPEVLELIQHELCHAWDRQAGRPSQDLSWDEAFSELLPFDQEKRREREAFAIICGLGPTGLSAYQVAASSCLQQVKADAALWALEHVFIAYEPEEVVLHEKSGWSEGIHPDAIFDPLIKQPLPDLVSAIWSASPNHGIVPILLSENVAGPEALASVSDELDWGRELLTFEGLGDRTGWISGPRIETSDGRHLDTFRRIDPDGSVLGAFRGTTETGEGYWIDGPCANQWGVPVDGGEAAWALGLSHGRVEWSRVW